MTSDLTIYGCADGWHRVESDGAFVGYVERVIVCGMCLDVDTGSAVTLENVEEFDVQRMTVSAQLYIESPSWYHPPEYHGSGADIADESVEDDTDIDAEPVLEELEAMDTDSSEEPTEIFGSIRV